MHLDLTAIILGVVALAFVSLVVLAIRRMRSPLRLQAHEDEGEDRLLGEGEELPEETEEGEGEGEEEEEEEGEEEAEAPPEGKAKPEPAAKAPTRERKKERADGAEEQERLRRGLAKTRGGFIAKLGSLFRSRKELDAELLDQVEEILFTADIGVQTSQELIDGIRRELGRQQLADPQAIWTLIKGKSADLLDQPGAGALDVTTAKPFVILVVGVNGTGKTTTIGKLAARLKAEGRTVLLAARDTFRAAAVEQLEVWGERAGVQVVRGKEGADPSSVIVDALKQAKQTNVDVVLADTAGRLHTKIDLMEELQKVRRAITRWVEGAPHETILVLDATTGQNAIAQARMFKEALSITGLILTKLDGTAKGGVVLGICNELKLPVRFIGIGEKIDDLREFHPRAFVEALYEGADGTDSPA